MTTPDVTVPAPGTPVDLRASSRRLGELVVKALLGLCALISIATTIGIVASLLLPALEFFAEVSPIEFFTGTNWAPLFEPAHFGVIPIVAATFVVTFWALLVAIPAGLGTAIFLSEYASPRARAFLKPALEILAGIPTVVYGYFALTAVTPLLREIGIQVEIFNALAGGLVMGVMLIPTVASLSEDAMAAVPRALRDGAYGLGADKLQVATRVIVPAAISGIIASFVLAISRAVGETMIVLIAVGQLANLSFDPRETMDDANGVHRRDRQRRPADRVDRVQDDLRSRSHALRDHVRDEHHLDPARAQVPRGLRLMSRQLKNRLFVGPMVLCLAISFGTLAWLLVQTFIDGIPGLDKKLLTDPPSSVPEEAGARPAILATIYMAILLLLMTVPIGVGTAIYLEEYANRERWYNRLLEVNIQNLAAVPAIVYGILGSRSSSVVHRGRTRAARRSA